MNAYLLLAALLIVGAMTGGAYWQGRVDGADGEIATQKREEDVARVATAAATQATAHAISKIEVRNVHIRQELEREVLTREVFRDCRSGPDAVRLFNAATTGARAASTPGSGELPATDPAR